MKSHQGYNLFSDWVLFQIRRIVYRSSLIHHALNIALVFNLYRSPIPSLSLRRNPSHLQNLKKNPPTHLRNVLPQRTKRRNSSKRRKLRKSSLLSIQTSANARMKTGGVTAAQANRKSHHPNPKSRLLSIQTSANARMKTRGVTAAQANLKSHYPNPKSRHPNL